MNTSKTILTLFLISVFLFIATFVTASDFDWTRDLNLRAKADPSGFRAQLSTRFNIGEAQIKVVLGNVDKPSDAYMVFRLGEMSTRPVEDVLSKYKTEKSRGWGSLAKSLGIKPGSKEFHALKQGDDMYDIDHKNKGSKKKKKGKGKG